MCNPLYKTPEISQISPLNVVFIVCCLARIQGLDSDYRRLIAKRRRYICTTTSASVGHKSIPLLLRVTCQRVARLLDIEFADCAVV
jgi:hypothetical protein